MSYTDERINDIKMSEKVSAFLDEHIYPSLPEKIVRIYDKTLQLRGVDVIWGDEYVDEKIAVKYINRNLTTFSFELSSLNNKDGKGWLLEDEHYLTESYLIGYLRGNLEMNNITEIELLLIDKYDIWDYLNKYNFPKSIVQAIRFGHIDPYSTKGNGVSYYKVNIPGVKVINSFRLKESPINVVINRDVLEKLATNIYLYKNKEVIIKK